MPLPLTTLATLPRDLLGQTFKDPRSLLAFERFQLYVAQIIPQTFAAFQNLDFVVTAADPQIPNAHVITAGANISVIPAAGLVTIKATPSGPDGQIQYNNAGTFGSFAVSGDATLNTSTGVLTLATVTTAGTYTKGTYDVKGRLITGATAVLASADFANQGTAHTVLHGNAAGNPSWSAVDLAADVSGNLPVTNLNGGSGASSTTYWRGDGTWATVSGGSGTVTSVGLAAPAIFTVSGSPVTTSGTLTFALNTQSANLVWVGPTTGAAAAPTFRALVTADLGTNTVANTTFRQSGALALVGRSANSTGNVADIQATAASNNILREKSSALQFDSLSNLLDDVFGSTVGGIVARGASAWGPIAASASGLALVSNGTGVLPSYQTVGSGGGGVYRNTTILGSPASTVTLTFPAGYENIQLVMLIRGTAAVTFDQYYIQFNSDTGANYSYQTGNSNQSTGAQFNGNSVTPANQNIGSLPCANALANEFAQVNVQIGAYARTAAIKKAWINVVGVLGSSVTNSIFTYGSGLVWNTNTALTSVTIGWHTGGNTFATNSEFVVIAI